MTGHYSRRMLEVQGISPVMLKNHPGIDSVRDLCDSSEFPAGFSNCPSRCSIKSETLSYSTLYSSVSSLDDDEFEKESSETVQQLFNNIDSMLYDDEESYSEAVQLREECKEWADQFCHLRVLGKQLVPDEDLGYQTFTVSTENLNFAAPSDADADVSTESVLGIHGRQMGISIPMDTNHSQNKPDSLETEQQEEIFILDGEYEELIAVDYSDDCNPFGSVIQQLHAGGENDVSIQKLSAIKESLSSFLGNQIWNEVVSWMRPLFVEFMKHVHSGFPQVLAQTAPPALPSNAMPKASIQPNARLATAPPRSTIQDDFKGLLTVTGKTLQLRNNKYNGSFPSQNYGFAATNAPNFVHNSNDSSYGIPKTHTAIRRVPTAVRLTPLDHSLKSNRSVTIKNEEWLVGQVNQRPKTTKQSLSTRVQSSYWNRQIQLPPIQNSESHSTSKNRVSKANINKVKKVSSDSLDFTLMEALTKDFNSKRLESRQPRLSNKQDVLWKKSESATLQPSTESSFASSQAGKAKLTEQSDTEVLDEETVHTVEPFVTWLLSQVQSNACKASSKTNPES